MKTRIILLLVLICLLATIDFYAQQPQLQWYAVYNSPSNGDDWAKSMALDSNGNVVVTGQDGNTNGGTVTIKYNNSGVLQWLTRYNGGQNIVSVPSKIVTDRNNNIYIIGDEGRGFLIKYNSSGVQQWKKIINGGYYSDITLDTLNNIYLSGGIQTGTNTSDLLVVKYSMNGDSLWAARYNRLPSSYPSISNSIKLDNLNNVIVCGWQYYQPGLTNILTVKFNSSGIFQWAQEFTRPNLENYGLSLVTDQINNIYISGISYAGSTGNVDIETIKYNSSGIQQWVSYYLNCYAQQYEDIAIDSQANIWILGRTGYPNWEYLTIKYSSSGVQQWVNILGRTSYDVFANSLSIDKSGDMVLPPKKKHIVKPHSLNFQNSQATNNQVLSVS